MSAVHPRLPTAAHTLWSALDTEVVRLHGRWLIYRQLFGTSAVRVEVLNLSAGAFFNFLQQTLLHDLQLSLRLLGEATASGPRTKLSPAALVRELKSSGEKAMAAKLKPLLAAVEARCHQIGRRGSQWAEHFDRGTPPKFEAVPLPSPYRAEIEAALDALRAFMNCVQLHYLNSQTRYGEAEMDCDGEQLIVSLMQGIRYRQLVKDKMIPQDDLRHTFKSGV